MQNKYLLPSILILILVQQVKAQNVGVGIPVPLAPLHVATLQPEVARLENLTALALGVNTELWFRTGSFFTGAIKAVGNSANTARLSFFTFASPTQTILSERMVILDNGSVGINQANPTAKFEVNGLIRITDGSQGPNKVLGCDGTGLASWKSDARENNFGATQASGFPVPSGTFTIIPFDNQNYDPGADFATGVYTVPATGIYHFDTDVPTNLQPIISAGNSILQLWVNAAPVRSVDATFGANSLFPSLNISCDLSLSAGNTVSVKIYQDNGTAASITIAGTSQHRNPHFTGHRIF